MTSISGGLVGTGFMWALWRRAFFVVVVLTSWGSLNVFGIIFQGISSTEDWPD